MPIRLAGWHGRPHSPCLLQRRTVGAAHDQLAIVLLHSILRGQLGPNVTARLARRKRVQPTQRIGILSLQARRALGHVKHGCALLDHWLCLHLCINITAYGSPWALKPADASLAASKQSPLRHHFCCGIYNICLSNCVHSARLLQVQLRPPPHAPMWVPCAVLGVESGPPWPPLPSAVARVVVVRSLNVPDSVCPSPSWPHPALLCIESRRARRRGVRGAGTHAAHAHRRPRSNHIRLWPAGRQFASTGAVRTAQSHPFSVKSLTSRTLSSPPYTFAHVCCYTSTSHCSCAASEVWPNANAKNIIQQQFSSGFGLTILAKHTNSRGTEHTRALDAHRQVPRGRLTPILPSIQDSWSLISFIG